MKGTYQLWDINLDDKTERKLAETKIESTPDTRFCIPTYFKDGYLMIWTEPIDKTSEFALFGEKVTYEDGEWKREKIIFPSKEIRIGFPGMPEGINSYEMKDGNTVYYIQGKFGEKRRDKNAVDGLAILDEHGEVTFKPLAENVNSWNFSFYDGVKWCNYILDNDVSAEQLEMFGRPLLKESKMMNYLYKQNGLVSRKIGDELFFIHYDYRATNGRPDYLIQLIHLPL